MERDGRSDRRQLGGVSPARACGRWPMQQSPGARGGGQRAYYDDEGLYREAAEDDNDDEEEEEGGSGAAAMMLLDVDLYGGASGRQVLLPG